MAETAVDFSSNFDYVIVFPLIGKDKNQQSPAAKFIFSELINAGLELYPYLSVQADELIVLIRCPVMIR
jgi:hypothetical protein